MILGRARVVQTCFSVQLTPKLRSIVKKATVQYARKRRRLPSEVA